MKCGGCEAAVTKQLAALDGVLSVQASSQNKTVTVEFEAEHVTVDVIKAIIAVAGFTVAEED
jgi:copper chaperone